MESLLSKKQAKFREPWTADFRERPVIGNALDRFVEEGESVFDTSFRLEVGG